MIALCSLGVEQNRYQECAGTGYLAFFFGTGAGTGNSGTGSGIPDGEKQGKFSFLSIIVRAFFWCAFHLESEGCFRSVDLELAEIFPMDFFCQETKVNRK